MKVDIKLGFTLESATNDVRTLKGWGIKDFVTTVLKL